MATKITIPKLGASVASLQLPEIDIGQEPFTPLARAVGEIGAAVEKRNIVVAQRDENDAQAWAASEEAGIVSSSTGEIARRRAAGLVGPGFASQFDREYEAQMNAALARAKTSRQRELLAQRLALRRAYVFQLAIQAEGSANEQTRKSQASEAADNLVGLANADPANIGDYRDSLEQLYDGLPAEEQENFDERREQLNEAYMRGLIRDNPKLAVETLRSREGAAGELGISEEKRVELLEDAERALGIEQAEQSAARQDAGIAASIEAKTYKLHLDDYANEPWRVYAPVLDAYDAEPKIGRRLEVKADAVVREVNERHANIVRVGRKIAAGERLHDEQVGQAFDQHWAAAVNDDGTTPHEVVHRRMIGVARLAGRVPDALQRRIRESVHSPDSSTRATAGRLLRDLDGDEHGDLLAWASPDIRAFGRDFAVLTDAGLGVTSAINRIGRAESIPAAQEEGRAHFFDGALGGDVLAAAVGRALGADIRDVEEPALPSEGDGRLYTTEYVPERDQVRFEPIVKRGPGGRVRFRPGDDRYTDGPGVGGPGQPIGYPINVGTIETDDGTLIEAWQNRSREPRLNSNCHGFAFAGGEVWINNDQVDRLLEHDCYRAVSERDVRPNDIVIYRDGDDPVHSAIVRGDNRHGTLIVEGKRGKADVYARTTTIDQQWTPADNYGRPTRKEFYRKFPCARKV